MNSNAKHTRREAIAVLGTFIGATSVAALPSSRKTENVDVGSPDYSLQAEIEALNIPGSVTVVGVGGFGSWAGYFAALAGVENLVFLDPGTVDRLDLARSPYTPQQIGRPKVEALAELIRSARPEAEIETYAKYFFVDRDGDLLRGVVLNGASDQDVQERLPHLAAQKGLKYAAGYYNGIDFGVMDHYPDNLRITSGSRTPVWPGSAALCAMVAVYSTFVSPVNFYGSLAAMNMDPEDLNDALLASEMNFEDGHIDNGWTLENRKKDPGDKAPKIDVNDHMSIGASK